MAWWMEEGEASQESDVATTWQATEAPILDQDTPSYISNCAKKGTTVAIPTENDLG